jgi:DNA-directed RNA polymerase specialized sigma24 family protein
MDKDRSLKEQDFNNLLEWFSPDREESGRQYEQIRFGLIRFFRFRGCNDPGSLADETINRVASKIGKFEESSAKAINIFQGFASKIYLEYRTRVRKEVQLDTDLPFHEPILEEDSNRKESIHVCLETCLNKLDPIENEMIIRYYNNDKSRRFESRRVMAENLKINMGALHTRVFRVRSSLKQCIERCLASPQV